MVRKTKKVNKTVADEPRVESVEKPKFDGYVIAFTVRKKNLNTILDMGHIAKYLVIGKNAYPIDSKAIELAKSGNITVKYQIDGVYNPILWFSQNGITVQKQPYPL